MAEAVSEVPVPEEAPVPRIFEAPDDYNPGDELLEEGHVLLISNSEFPLGKWPPVPIELTADFDGLKQFIDHDFIGKIPINNMTALRNPNTTDVLNTLDTLSKKLTKNSFLVIYIATHVITINKSNKEVPNENAYFAFRNSIWSPNKHSETMDTCIPLVTLTEYVNRIPCQEKTFLINFALTPPQKKTLFTAAKIVYPTEDFAERLSNLCRAPVLASCANGFSSVYYSKAHPECLYNDNFIRRRLFRSPSSLLPKNRKGKKGKKQKKKVTLFDNNTNSQQLQSNKAGPNQKVGIDLSSSLLSNSPNSSINNSTVVPLDPAIIPPGSIAPKTLEELFHSNKWQRFMADWELPQDKPIRISPKPDKPVPRWESQGIGSAATLKVEIPTNAEVTTYQRRLLFWRTKRALAKPVNFMRESYRFHRKMTQRAPREHSLAFNGHTIFAKCLMDIIRLGMACISSEDCVRLDTVYYHLYHLMKKQIQAMREKQAQDEALEKQRIQAAIDAAIAEEQGLTGNGDNNNANNNNTEDALSDTIQRKKTAAQSNQDKKNHKKKKKKKEQEVVEEKEIIAQTPALFFPTIGVQAVKRAFLLSSLFGHSSTPAIGNNNISYYSNNNAEDSKNAYTWNKKPVYLTTELALPFLEHRLFFRCGLPPAPERPFITLVTAHTVTLTWYNPPFDGIAPLYYRLQMENVSRNFQDWQYVRLPGGPSDALQYLAKQIKHFEEEEEDRRQLLQQGYAYYCIKDTTYMVRDLPMGIACRFRVQAFNPGGWSDFSEPSDYVTPGEDQTPIPSYMLWKRLTQSGCLGILDRIKRYLHNAEEQREGMRRLAAFGNNNHGFLKGPIALAIAEHCIYNLRHFPDDPDIIQFTLTTMIWTLMGGKGERKVRFYYTQVPLPISIEEILLMKEVRRRRSSIADAVDKAAADVADVAANAAINAAVMGDQLHYQQQRRQIAHSSKNASMNNNGIDSSNNNTTGTQISNDEAILEQMQSLVGILNLLWQRWRHHSGIVNAFQGLRGAGGQGTALQTQFGRYLGPVGLVGKFEMYNPPVHFPPPEAEKKGDAWSDEDEEEEEGMNEEDVAALENMMRERQASLQSKEKQEKVEAKETMGKQSKSQPTLAIAGNK